MSNIQSAVRSLVVYAICIPAAIFLGYLLTDPLQRETFVTVTVVLAILCSPLLIGFHYPLMLLMWNATAVLFFLPGRPTIGAAAIALSFLISLTRRSLDRRYQFLKVPSVTRPLVLMAIVVLATAQLTGGIGLRALGGEVYGGKRYLLLLLSIMSYFALTAYRIPRERAGLYVALFFLGGVTNLIGDLFPVLISWMPYLFWLFPVFSTETGNIVLGSTRLSGLTGAGAALFCLMMARYGIQGLLLSGKPLRLIAFIAFGCAGLLGGFRSTLLFMLVCFGIQFFLEGLHRTKLLPVMVLAGVLMAALAVPFTSKLPFTIQRALAVFPVPIDAVARLDAQTSSEWRLRMWKAVLPQVPQYLLLGKGLALTRADFDSTNERAFETQAISGDQIGAALAGDYHNGPLSVVIPFGIWGAIAFVWFLLAGFRILLNNYRHGDPALRVINAFLLADFVTRVFMFFVVVGGLTTDMLHFGAVVGLSVSMNWGVAQQPTTTEETSGLLQPLPGFPNRSRPAIG
jgi:hypothetical protein